MSMFLIAILMCYKPKTKSEIFSRKKISCLSDRSLFITISLSSLHNNNAWVYTRNDEPRLLLKYDHIG